MGCVLDGHRFTERSVVEREPGMNKIAQRLKDRISVAPDQLCTVWHETVETKRSTDIAHWVFEHPTRNPLVTVRTVPSSADAKPPVVTIRFNSRHREERDQLGAGAFRMHGTLNPYQSIELRWFMKRDYEVWAAENLSS